MADHDAATLRHVADRIEIGDLVTSYFVNVDRRAWDAVKAVFVPGTLVDYHDMMPVGDAVPAEEIVDEIAERIGLYAVTAHQMTNHEVVVEGDEARSECWVTAVHVYADPERNEGRLPVAGIRYLDRCVRTPDGWRVRDRTVTTDWRSWMDPRGPTYVDGAHQ